MPIGFAQQVRAFRINAVDRSERVWKRAMELLLESIVYHTPVLRGRLVANWRITRTGNLVEAEVKGVDPARQRTLARLFLNIRNASLGDELTVYNNTPYAYRIEYERWSRKAPSGMMNINTRRWVDFVRRANREIS